MKPEVKWPKLGDDGPGGKEIETEIFYERFEEVASITNDGDGMNDKEMLMVLKTNLSDSKRKIYENVYRTHRHRDRERRICHIQGHKG